MNFTDQDAFLIEYRLWNYQIGGRFPGFPEPDEWPEGGKLNLGCGNVTLSPEQGWTNLDRVALPGVDEVWDCFRFPWPFEDASFDYILASNIVEHIPHQVQRWNVPPGWPEVLVFPGPELEWCHDEGFFVFFRECWRILKPGGVICIVSPHGFSTMGLQDPTHTRYLVPQSFHYLWSTNKTAFDYDLGFRYELSAPVRVYIDDRLGDMPFDEMQRQAVYNINVQLSLRVDLRKPDMKEHHG